MSFLTNSVCVSFFGLSRITAKMLRDAGLMDERDYRTYTELFANMSNFMKKPNVIVHLDVTPAQSMERIKKRLILCFLFSLSLSLFTEMYHDPPFPFHRNRDCESTITLEYLTDLHAAYETFLRAIARVIPVIRVKWDTFRSADEMAASIRSEYLKMQNVHHVDFMNQTPESDESEGVTLSPPAKPTMVIAGKEAC